LADLSKKKVRTLAVELAWVWFPGTIQFFVFVRKYWKA